MTPRGSADGVLPHAFILLLALLVPGWLLALDFPPPPNAEVASISSSTKAMGMQLEIRSFYVKLSPDEVLAFYKRLWKDQSVESEMPPWRMLGTRQDRHFLNVQVQPKGAEGAWGYLSVSDLPERLDNKSYGTDTGPAFPMMGGSQVLDDQQSKDIGKSGRVLLIKNGFSPRANLHFYKNHFHGQGWDILMDEQTAPRDGGYALYMNKGSESLTLTINRLEGETSIVANQVKRSLLP